MKFAVPQFIDVEDKIFGPLTFRQFVYLAGGGGLCYLLIRLLPTFLGIVIALPIAALAGALAFIKFNNKPFLDIIESAVNYVLRNKLYIWRKDKLANDTEKKGDDLTKIPTYVPKLSPSKLHDISWGLDVLDKSQRS